ncbi:MAG: 50S ribosomal protein L4 [Planctomycetes bacterium]|jgi:large subunit ribosomal protein L4|nr:50S ribosomal protein L4 [Planctomycetota bacterium]
MLEVSVYNTSGEKIETLKVDEAAFGGEVNISLLKQAVVAYHANQRQGTAKSKTRAEVQGSTKKLYRQKGTGNARRGNVRTNVMRGGGHAFGKRPRDHRKDMPRSMRRAALNSALLAKMLGDDLLVVDGLKAESPKTAPIAKVLENLKINRSCLLTLAQHDQNMYLSARNIPDITVRVAGDLNAFEVATRQKMLVTREAMDAILARETQRA